MLLGYILGNHAVAKTISFMLLYIHHPSDPEADMDKKWHNKLFHVGVGAFALTVVLAGISGGLNLKGYHTASVVLGWMTLVSLVATIVSLAGALIGLARSRPPD
jgi:hypothetical protein